MVQPASRPPSGASEPGAATRPVTGGREISDAQLVERARRGDRWAEEMLYRRHASHLLGICTRLLRELMDAEDVVQDAFVDAFDQMSSLREPGMFRRWLTGIAVHKAHRRLRRRKLLRALGLWDAKPELTLETCLAPGASPEVYSEIVCLDHALTQLPDAQRIAWQLRTVEGYRLEEVAELCDCSLATVKRRLSRADACVRKHVQIEEVTRG
jgi:RNA polymerase sigma-70 factor (ECF subfamily)